MEDLIIMEYSLECNTPRTHYKITNIKVPDFSNDRTFIPIPFMIRF